MLRPAARRRAPRRAASAARRATAAAIALFVLAACERHDRVTGPADPGPPAEEAAPTPAEFSVDGAPAADSVQGNAQSAAALADR